MADFERCDSDDTYCSIFQSSQYEIEAERHDVLSGVTIFKSLEVLDSDDVIYESQVGAKTKNQARSGILKRSTRLSQASTLNTKINNPAKLPQKCKSNTETKYGRFSQQSVSNTRISKSKKLSQKPTINIGARRSKRISQKCTSTINDCPFSQISDFLNADTKENDKPQTQKIRGRPKKKSEEPDSIYFKVDKLQQVISNCNKLCEGLLNWSKYQYCMLKDIELQIQKISKNIKQKTKSSQNRANNKRKSKTELKKSHLNDNNNVPKKRIRKPKTTKANKKDEPATQTTQQTQTFCVNTEDTLFECSQISDNDLPQTPKPWLNKAFWENKRASIPKQWLNDLSMW